MKRFHLEKFHPENFCKVQNLELINSSIIYKSDLALETFNLKYCGSFKMAKNFLEYVYLMSVIGNSMRMKLNKMMSL